LPNGKILLIFFLLYSNYSSKFIILVCFSLKKFITFFILSLLDFDFILCIVNIKRIFHNLQNKNVLEYKENHVNLSIFVLRKNIDDLTLRMLTFYFELF
jgi:hypothetical protein